MVGPGFRFMRARLPAAGPIRHCRADQYTDPWIAGIKREPGQVLAVIGFRTGCVHATAISTGISRWQPMPKMILLDPESVSCANLSRALHAETNSISPLLTSDEIEGARKIIAAFPGPATASVAEAAIKAVAAYREISLAPFERAGLGGTWYEELIAPFISRISWLSAAGQLNPGPVWRYATALVSSTAERLGGAAGRTIPLAMTQAELMRSERVAAVIRDLLAAAQPEGHR